jgi:hypothetical protein
MLSLRAGYYQKFPDFGLYYAILILDITGREEAILLHRRY